MSGIQWWIFQAHAQDASHIIGERISRKEERRKKMRTEEEEIFKDE